MTTLCTMLLAGLLSTTPTVQSQTHPPPKSQITAGDDEQYTIKSDVELVLLDVAVKDNKGAFVTGLERHNFEVFEEGRPEPITQFASIDTPVTVGLVVDNSGSMRPKRAEVITAGLAFAEESNPHDEFFVVNFNNYIVPGLPSRVPFTDNIQLLRKALYHGVPTGRTALYDAIATALSHIQLGARDKRTLIVVSDGGDNESQISLADLLHVIQSSRVTIYTVGLFDREDRDRNPGVLRKIANISGGEFYMPPSLDDVGPAFHKISQEIRSRYTIGYLPDPHIDRSAHRVRSIKVIAKADHQKLAVHTRTSYSLTPLSQTMAGWLSQHPNP
ncbi:MAG: VWA domain-containing protein [Bryobacteraceae bacterium]